MFFAKWVRQHRCQDAQVSSSERECPTLYVRGFGLQVVRESCVEDQNGSGVVSFVVAPERGTGSGPCSGENGVLETLMSLTGDRVDTAKDPPAFES